MIWVQVAAANAQEPRDAEAGRAGAKGETSRVARQQERPGSSTEEPGRFADALDGINPNGW